VNAVTPPQVLASATSDEIDLIQLLRALWKQKFLIGGIAGVCALVGLLYAMLAPRYYTVQSVLRPAAIKDLDELNHLGIYKLTSP